MKKRTILPGESTFTSFYTGSIMLVSALDNAGRADICTLSDWSLCNSKPPMYGFALYNHDRSSDPNEFKRYTLTCIEETGEFVINVPDMNLAPALRSCGTVSLRKNPEVDKFALCSLTRGKASVVKAPLIAECPLNIECRVAGVLHLADHDWVVGEAVAIHCAFETEGSPFAIPILDMVDVCRAKPRLK